jgi:hypothetical protein
VDHHRLPDAPDYRRQTFRSLTNAARSDGSILGQLGVTITTGIWPESTNSWKRVFPTPIHADPLAKVSSPQLAVFSRPLLKDSL